MSTDLELNINNSNITQLKKILKSYPDLLSYVDSNLDTTIKDLGKTEIKTIEAKEFFKPF
jgi:hypothetical protein